MSLSALLLAGCSAASDSSSSLSSGGDASNSDSSKSSEAISSEESSSSDGSSSLSVHIPTEMVGTWYVTSSTTGTIPLNGIFEIKSDDTLEIGERTLALKGTYANFDDAYLFSYGTIRFVVSFDSVKEGIDWGYQNGEDYDLGFASSEPIDNSYDYEGNTFPMDKINEYLGTKGSITPMSSSTYRLKLFTSSLNEMKCASIEMPGTKLKNVMSYITDLIDEGYTFPAYGGSLSAGSFAIGYDQSKTYLVRIVFFDNDEEEDETDMFIYSYDDTLLPKESSSESL